MTASDLNPHILQKWSPERTRARFRLWSRRLARPQVLIGLAMLFLLAVFVGAPLWRMAQDALTWQTGDQRLAPEAQTGALTLFHWQRMLLSANSLSLFYIPMRNSLLTGVGATLIAVLIGASLAWLTARTDLPVRGLVLKMAAFPFVYSAWTLSLAWLEIFRNRRLGGGLGVLEMLGFTPPDWLAYGPIPIAICLGLHEFIFPFLLVFTALRTLDSNLEDAAEIFGAHRLRILLRITFPLVLPALLSGVILAFADAVDAYGPSYLLGTPVRFYTLATMIRATLTRGQLSDGFVLAFLLMAFSALAIYLNQRLIGARRSYVTLAGKGASRRLTPLRRWKYPLSLLVVVFLAVVAFLPLAIILSQTFLRVPGVYQLDNLTLHYWIGKSDPAFSSGEPGILYNPEVWSAAWNSLLLAGGTALTTTLLGLLAGYAIVRGRGAALGRLLEQFIFIPYLMPGIALGAAFISMLSRPLGPMPVLYGTLWALLIATTVKNIPNISRITVSTLLQIGGELEESAAVGGARWPRRFFRLILPLAFPALAAGILMTFNAVMRELSLLILLVTPATQVLISLVLEYVTQAKQQMAYTVQVILIGIMMLGTLLLNRLGEDRPSTAAARGVEVGAE